MSIAQTLLLPAAMLAVALALSGPVAAAGSDDEPPKTTKTTTECEKGKIWDEKTKACVDAQDSRLDDDTRFDAVRELAYAGRPDEALDVLAAMTEGETDRVLTYLGFANRLAGNVDRGMDFYERAIAQNPDNLLARSYMGQAFVKAGEMDLAQAQLDEIVARGGTGSWPERSLRRAISTQETFNY